MAFHRNLRYNVLFLVATLLITQSYAREITKKSTRDTSFDLKTAASSYSHQYYDWAGAQPGGYDYIVSGNTIDNYIPRAGFTNPLKESSHGDNPYYTGQDFGYQNPEPQPQPVSNDGIQNYNGGYGGYGGYGGNGGLSSYNGYNNPYYHGANHLGYGYYNKKIGYGSIYNSGVTPNLVVGYRGYTRR